MAPAKMQELAKSDNWAARGVEILALHPSAMRSGTWMYECKRQRYGIGSALGAAGLCRKYQRTAGWWSRVAGGYWELKMKLRSSRRQKSAKLNPEAKEKYLQDKLVRNMMHFVTKHETRLHEVVKRAQGYD